MKVNLSIYLIIFTVLSETVYSNASTVNKTKYFNSLLSDFLRIHNEFGENLQVSFECKMELDTIQNSLNDKVIWAWKCKYEKLFSFIISSRCSTLNLQNKFKM